MTKPVSTAGGLVLLALAATAGVLISTVINVHIRLAGASGQMHPGLTYLFAAAFDLIGLAVLLPAHALLADRFAYETEWHWSCAGFLYAGTWAAFIFGQLFFALAFAVAPALLRIAHVMPRRAMR